MDDAVRRLNVDLRAPRPGAPIAIVGMALASALLLALATGLAWTWLQSRAQVAAERRPEAAEPGPRSAGPATPAASWGGPGSTGDAVAPYADDARRWAQEAAFPIAQVFVWLEAAVTPGVRLVRVDAQAAAPVVALEVQAVSTASIGRYLEALGRQSASTGEGTTAARPAWRWRLRSLHARDTGGGYVAQLEGHP